MNKAISLFSGMGGDTLGINNSNKFKVIAYSEKEKEFCKTHEENFKDCELIDNNILNITEDKLKKYKNKIDLIFAGFPCQGFSNAGKKQLNDPRNTLFKEFLRLSNILKPKYIIGENVKGLLSRKTDNDELYIDVIKKSFEDIGYNVIYQVFKTNEYNIPQKRERLIILGVLKDCNIKLSFPEPIKNNNLNLKHIINFNMYGAIKIKKSDFDMTTIPNECILTDLNNEEDENNIHPYLKMLIKELPYTYKDKTYNCRVSFGKRDSSIHSEIIDIRSPSKTIICTYGRQPRFFVPLKNKNGYYLRCLLPDELKQIQGFPKDYKLCGNLQKKITQIGNAVPPNLITAIVNNLE